MICAKSPASMANLGPGFDVVAVALDGPFDVVCLDLREEPGLDVEVMGPPHASLVPPQASENVIHPVLTGAARIAGYEGGDSRLVYGRESGLPAVWGGAAARMPRRRLTWPRGSWGGLA